jgi:hypothetical protein
LAYFGVSAKWFFDFTRNLMILGVLKYLSSRSSPPGANGHDANGPL